MPGSSAFPPYVTMAHTFHAPEGWRIVNRIMREYVLQYVVKGTAEYPVEGRPYTTVTGDLLFHRPGEMHSIMTIPGQPYVCISIVFHFGDSPFPLEADIRNIHMLGNFAGQPIERNLSRLVQLYRMPGEAYQLQCRGLLMQILGEACAAQQQRNPDNKPAGHPAVAKLILIKHYILNHYNEPIRLQQLTEVSGLSENYMVSAFRQAFGLAPLQYAAWVRVRKAKELAIQTNLTVSEIAGEVGYADVHAFGKMFKKQTGMSLTEFCKTLTVQR